MKKSRVAVIFDRKKKVAKTGKGVVELRIYLNHRESKFITMGEITLNEWKGYTSLPSVQAEVARYESIVQAMLTLGTPLTIANLNKLLGKEKEEEETMANQKSNTFISFMYDELHAEHIEPRTIQAREVMYRSVLAFGKLKRFEDLTPANILEFHKWLQKDGKRKATTLKHYHKRLHRYVLKAFEYGYIDRDPYKLVKIPAGQYEERKPLNEDEISLLLSLQLPPKEEKARDLFIFSCFTGLAYCDAQYFDFHTMTEKEGDLYYIIGTRLKSGSTFYTPILDPAMEVPKMNNSYYNKYLKSLAVMAGITTRMHTHLARHTFATWVLAHDVPIENVTRMLGQKDVRTTQVYAKILPKTIQRHAESLNQSIKSRPTKPKTQPKPQAQPQPQSEVVVQPVSTYSYSYENNSLYINISL